MRLAVIGGGPTGLYFALLLKGVQIGRISRERLESLAAALEGR